MTLALTAVGSFLGMKLAALRGRCAFFHRFFKAGRSRTQQHTAVHWGVAV